MASTYTTSLKIQQIGSGEQSGVWGSTTNTNWNLIEEAIAGVRNITMSNADYTLSNLNGVSDEARNMVLMITGTNSAIRKIIAPLVQKFYVVFNNTTGGYAVTIGGSTGSIITIPSGNTAQVYCDGTNFYSAQTGSAGDFTVNGNLIVTGNETEIGNLTAGNVSTSGTFTGPGTGLTGTAAALTVGNATVAATANTLNTANNYTAVNFTATGVMNAQALYLSQTAPTVWFTDTNGLGFANQVNNNYWYVLNNSALSVIAVDQNGNFTAAGNVTAYSDERLKRNWAGLEANFVERLAQVKSGTYERIDNGNKQVGVSAQSLQTLMPEAVMTNAEGVLSVAYGNAAMAAVVELAKELVALKAEIKQLKGE